jgi:hypothetical protein
VSRDANTDLAHKFVLKLEVIRIRVLDRFGEPHRNVVCDVEIPAFGQTQKSTDNKGWLELRCPPRTMFVDLTLQGVNESATRRVLLRPAWEADGQKQRLANLGFSGKDERENGRAFQRAHRFDVVEDALPEHLDEVESDCKTLDDPRDHDAKILDDQVHDLASTGERT